MTPPIALLPLLMVPALVAGVVYFLRVWPRLPHLVAALAATIMTQVLRSTPPGLTDELLGRPLLLDLPAKQVLLIALAAVALGNLLLAVRGSSDLFPSVSLATVSLIGISATVDNYTLAALVLLPATVLVTLVWDARGRAGGQLQYLVAVALGTVLLAYSAAVIGLTPDVPSRMGLVTYALGAGLLLGLVPLGLWRVNLGRDSEPVLSVLVGLVLSPAILLLLWRFSTRHLWLGAGTLLPQGIKAAALLTIGYCSLRAAVASSMRVFVAAAAQAQFALVMLVFPPSLGSTSLLPLTSEWLLARVVPILLLAVIASMLSRRAGTALRIAFAFAIVALLGLPGTPLFAVYLSGLLALPLAGLATGLLMLSAGVTIGGLRVASNPPAPEPAVGVPPWSPLQIAICLSLLVALSLYLGLHPSVMRTFLG